MNKIYITNSSAEYWYCALTPSLERDAAVKIAQRHTMEFIYGNQAYTKREILPASGAEGSEALTKGGGGKRRNN